MKDTNFFNYKEKKVEKEITFENNKYKSSSFSKKLAKYFQNLPFNTFFICKDSLT